MTFCSSIFFVPFVVLIACILFYDFLIKRESKRNIPKSLLCTSYVNPNQNGQGWKWPYCVWRLNAIECLKYEKTYKFLLLNVLIWKFLLLSAEIKFLSMILLLFKKLQKHKDKILPWPLCIGDKNDQFPETHYWTIMCTL